MRGLIPVLVVAVLAGCAPDFSTPNSPSQWERRQQAIQKREDERQAFCRMNDASNERYRRDCTAPGARP